MLMNSTYNICIDLWLSLIDFSLWFAYLDIFRWMPNIVNVLELEFFCLQDTVDFLNIVSLGLAFQKLGGNIASNIQSKTVSPLLAASESSIKCLWIQIFYCHLAAMMVVPGLVYCFIKCSFPGWDTFLMWVWVSALLSPYTGLWWSLRCLFSASVPPQPPKVPLINSEVCWALTKFLSLYIWLMLVNRNSQGLTQLFLDS